MDRIDARAKVTGTAKYSSDHNLPEMAYGYMVTSTIGKGQITSMDLSMARAAGE